MNNPRLQALLERLVLNARGVREPDILLNPDWVVVPRDLIEQIDDILKESRPKDAE